MRRWLPVIVLAGLVGAVLPAGGRRRPAPTTPPGASTMSTWCRLPAGSSWEPGEQPQVEGMVVDTRAKVLYAAQDDVGVWRMGVDLGRTRPTLVDRVREFGVPTSFDEAEGRPSVGDPRR